MKNLIEKQSKYFNLLGLMLIIIFLSIPFNLKSQEIQNFDDLRTAKSEPSDLSSLYYDNHPSLLIKSKKAVLTSEKSQARVVELNVSNLHLLNEQDYDLSGIELIRVIYNQSDKTSILDLSKIKAMKNLKAEVHLRSHDKTSFK